MGTESAEPKQSLVERLRSERHKHRQRPKPVRALYVVAGFTVLAAGVAMLVTPGPAFVVIPVGLALLSLEFVWAEQLLEATMRRGEQARLLAAQATRTERVLSAAAVLLGCAAIFAWAWFGDIPILPV
ncbi:MAG: putative transrane protein [bacterium]|jgi:uncharacterized protein (TIGR02611 family)